MIMAPLAHMFSELVNATNDVCPAVSARAIIMLETIPKKVVKVSKDKIKDGRRFFNVSFLILTPTPCEGVYL